MAVADDSTSSIELSVFINHSFYLSAKAESYREDVSLGPGLKAVGFSIPLPENLPENSFVTIYDAASKLITGSPYSLGPQHFDHRVIVRNGYILSGRVAPRALNVHVSSFYLRILLDGNLIATRLLGFDQEQGRRDPFAFICDLPRTVLDGAEHQIELEVLQNETLTPLHANYIFQSEYVGKIEHITPRKISGWIANLSAPRTPVELDAYVNGKHVAIEKANLPYQPKVISGLNLGSRIGFEIDLPLQSAYHTNLELEIKVAGCDKRVFVESHVFTSYDTAVRSLERCLNALNTDQEADAAGLPLTNDEMHWVRTNLLAPLLAEFRKNRTIPKMLTVNLSPTFTKTNAEKEKIIDVIIPVYKGKEETLACINSVINAKSDFAIEIIVINDHSPDYDLTLALRSLSVSGRITLVENSRNLGFVKSVNRGMSMHLLRDVILLNSDTLVPDQWIDRLVSAAYSDSNIGTVTPFTNNGTICSFPEICQDNQLPEGWTLDALDDVFRIQNSAVFDLPTAVGFCMFIRRSTIDEVGLFDEEKFKKGYGEENDFCLRASGYGWRNVIATNLFVQHLGSVSFAGNKEGYISENLPKLYQAYPDYELKVTRFVNLDPLAKYRTPIIRELLARKSAVHMLHVIHKLGGGTQVAVESLKDRLRAEGEEVLYLNAIRPEKWEIICPDTTYRLVYDLPMDEEILVQDLQILGVWHVHYHQMMDFPPSILQLADKLGVTYDFSTHDYLPICPRVNFVDETGYYCGDSRLSTEGCNQCLKLYEWPLLRQDIFDEYGKDVANWRNKYSIFLKAARKIISPSNESASFYKEHFGLQNIVVKPHPEALYHIKQKIKQGRLLSQISVAVIGAIGEHKGYEVLYECAKRALKDGLPIRFVVIGYTADDDELVKLPNVEITGKYETADLPYLIEQYDCSVAAFLSTWPETFSYTFSEALQNGLYPIAFDIGAIAERIKQYGFGKVVPLHSKPSEINAAILHILNDIPVIPQVELGTDYPTIIQDYYGFKRKAIESDQEN